MKICRVFSFFRRKQNMPCFFFYCYDVYKPQTGRYKRQRKRQWRAAACVPGWDAGKLWLAVLTLPAYTTEKLCLLNDCCKTSVLTRLTGNSVDMIFLTVLQVHFMTNHPSWRGHSKKDSSAKDTFEEKSAKWNLIGCNEQLCWWYIQKTHLILKFSQEHRTLQ